MYAVLNLRPFDPAHVNAMPRRVRYVCTVVIAPANAERVYLPGYSQMSSPARLGPAPWCPKIPPWSPLRNLAFEVDAGWVRRWSTPEHPVVRVSL